MPGNIGSQPPACSRHSLNKLLSGYVGTVSLLNVLDRHLHHCTDVTTREHHSAYIGKTSKT